MELRGKMPSPLSPTTSSYPALPFTSCNTWVSSPASSSGKCSRADSVDGVGEGRGDWPKNMSMSDLAPTLICHMAWAGERHPPPSMPEVGGGAGPEVIRVGELPLTSCSAWESRLCTSPGQHSGAGSKGRGVGESTLRA